MMRCFLMHTIVRDGGARGSSAAFRIGTHASPPPRRADGSGASSGRHRPGREDYFFFLPFFLSFLPFFAMQLTPFRLFGQQYVDEEVNISLTGANCRYAVLVASKNPVRRISAALGALDAAGGPIDRLEAARQLREAAEELETAQVVAARKAGATWIEIGACYGLTKQGAQQRFRAIRNSLKPAPPPPET
jgi:hypothetical protein